MMLNLLASLRYLLLMSFMLVMLASCERVFDKDASYKYRVHNKADAPVEITIKIKENPGVDIQGSPYRYYTIAPGATTEVWVTSGFTDDTVYDEEKKNTSLYWFEITAATKNGQPAKIYLNAPGAWEFNKENSYKATYTLTLEDKDFL
ncbi:hypothetical protein [uncultured Pontibacter sp.]|uniref:hypothetical protein n=1 Tax=uncultured Pontibacter sp. TaxID=453356 RepID=UPI0026218107|nr:hypothetical protein [uncultured Pontibacter sp.]